MSKINVLVISNDNDGVGYYRMNAPYLSLNDPDINVRFLPISDWNFRFDENTLKDFHVIIYHKDIPFRVQEDVDNFRNVIKKLGIKLIFDIDDHWLLHSSHINYNQWKKGNSMEKIIETIKNADYVTTTTPLFADEIKEYNKNVLVVENAINHKEYQWIPKKIKSDKVRFIWGGGITHKPDLMLMKDDFKKFDKNFLENAQIVMCGFDLRMRTDNGIYMDDPRRNTWTHFESIFTNSWKWIRNAEYLSFLNSYTDLGRLNYGYNEKFKDEFYQRRWTKPIFTYGTMYNEADIALAPLKSDIRFNLAKCIVFDSLISTKDGFLNIGDIVNNKINTSTEINGNINNIKNYFKYENVDTIKITTYDGYSIEGTPHHKLLINNKWIELKDLKIDDEIELTKPIILQNEYQYITYPMLLTKNTENKINRSDESMLPRIQINENWARLLGYLLGDGSLNGKSNISISCDKRYDDVVKDIFNLFTSIGLDPKICPKKIDKRCKNNLSKEGFGIDVKLTSMTFIKIAKKYNWIGKNGKIFRIPDVILKSPKSVIREFLKGLFESDGTVGENTPVSLTSKDLKLIEQIQILLLSFGIQSKISHSYNKHYRKYYYRLELRRQGSDIFFKEIGFISKGKNDKLKKLFENDHSNNEFEQTFKDKISKIEYNKNDVFDIEIEDVHSYNANGIINHNSQLKVIEAGIHKCPIIASNYGPYTLDVIDGKNGFLINEGDSGKWYEKMKFFVDNPNAIIDMGSSLNELVLEKYTLEKVNQKRIDLIKSIVK